MSTSNIDRVKGRNITRPALLAAMGFGGGLLVAVPMMGQRPTTTPNAAVATAALPAPLVTAGFLPPPRAVEWGRYRYIDECTGVPSWARAQALYDSLDRTPIVDQQRTRDTSVGNPWAPVPERVRVLTQACLRHFTAASVPGFETSTIVALTLTANADTLLRALLAQWLATNANSPAAQRAAVLDTMIAILMQGPGVPGQPAPVQPSPTVVELAHQYATQLMRLGPEAGPVQLDVLGILNRPAEYVDDSQQILAELETERTDVHQWTPAAVRAQFHTSLDTVDRVYQGFEARIRWRATDSLPWLRTFVQAAQTFPLRLPQLHLGLLGATAAPVTADYCFQGAHDTTPSVSPTMSLVQRGVPNLVIVQEASEDVPWRDFAIVRRLHQEFPKLRIVVIELLTGRYQGHWLADQPAQEARLRYQVLVDSLGVAAHVCMSQQRYQTLPNGEALPLTTPVEHAYDLDVNEPGWFLIDPKGAVVDVYGMDYYRYRTFLRHWTGR